MVLKALKPELRRHQPLAAQLRARRCCLNLTLEEAAALIGVQRWTLGLWENGAQRPQSRYRDAILKFLGPAPERYEE